MIDLLQAGSLERCQTLPHEIDAERLRIALQGRTGQVHALNFQRRLEIFKEMDGPPDLIQVLTEHLALAGLVPGRTDRRPQRRRGTRLTRLLGR
jgi:hypothetical protein